MGYFVIEKLIYYSFVINLLEIIFDYILLHNISAFSIKHIFVHIHTYIHIVHKKNKIKYIYVYIYYNM